MEVYLSVFLSRSFNTSFFWQSNASIGLLRKVALGKNDVQSCPVEFIKASRSSASSRE